MNFAPIEQLANAVLYEGHMLYPYRASALKNQFRWQFGVVFPREYSESEGSERWFIQTECLAELGAHAAVTIKLRFLQIQARTIEIAAPGRDGRWSPADTVTVGDDEFTTWDETVECSLVGGFRTADGGLHEFPIEISPARRVDLKCDAAGRQAAHVVRECWPILGRMVVAVQAGDPVSKITVRVENTTPWNGRSERRVALRQALIGAHTLLAIEDGAFLSLQDPPPQACDAARHCVNLGSWPVLAGRPGTHDLILAAPIILGDYPAIAPESAGDLFDATEIDELLTLRVMTLTGQEKREARATDERTRRMIERTDEAHADTLLQLHGATRTVAPAASVLDSNTTRLTNQQEWEALLNPSSASAPEHATLDIGGTSVAAGSKVRLNPQRCADPIDMFLAGRVATVIGVYCTLEDHSFVAVTIDNDPAADLRRATGRFFYFSPDELMPIESDPSCPGTDGAR